MFQRIVKLPKSNSFFLFGPRGTGKSWLIKNSIPLESVYVINLLDDVTESEFALNPGLLNKVVAALRPSQTIVFIDEIQKVPKLLDLVHKLIEETKIQFILTGSSARKLRHGGANLLAGRAFERNLFPLTNFELKNEFQLDKILQWGSLPKIFSFKDDSDKYDFLVSYSNTYLKQEVFAEQLVRKLDPFRKFLAIAARSDGKIINFKAVADQTGVDSKTVQNYFQIIEDTLLGFYLESYHTSLRTRTSKHPKFYFFDSGVTRAMANLLRVEPTKGTSYYGDVFESWLINEIFRLNNYLQTDFTFSYFLDHDSKAQADLIIERPGKKKVVIEIKSTENVGESHCVQLAAALPYLKGSVAYVFSNDRTRKKFGSIEAMHWEDGLKEIF